MRKRLTDVESVVVDTSKSQVTLSKASALKKPINLSLLLSDGSSSESHDEVYSLMRETMSELRKLPVVKESDKYKIPNVDRETLRRTRVASKKYTELMGQI